MRLEQTPERWQKRARWYQSFTGDKWMENGSQEKGWNQNQRKAASEGGNWRERAKKRKVRLERDSWYREL